MKTHQRMHDLPKEVRQLDFKEYLTLSKMNLAHIYLNAYRYPQRQLILVNATMLTISHWYDQLKLLTSTQYLYHKWLFHHQLHKKPLYINQNLPCTQLKYHLPNLRAL